MAARAVALLCWLAAPAASEPPAMRADDALAEDCESCGVGLLQRRAEGRAAAAGATDADFAASANATTRTEAESSSAANETALNCAVNPKACHWRVKCPVVGALITGGWLRPTGPKGFATQSMLVTALKDGAKSSEESAFLMAIDALYSPGVDVFDLPPNHLGNTGIRSKGYIDKAAFEYLWKRFARTTRTGKRLMCVEDMKEAGDYYRQQATHPGTDSEVFWNWRGTVHGTPVSRDITALTMLALPLMFGKEYGNTTCLTYSALASIYLESKFPPGDIKAVGTERFIKGAQLAGKVANSKWHIPYMIAEYLRLKALGKIAPDTVFVHKAMIAPWIA